MTAVTIFFVISGFYMALVLDEKYKGKTLDFYRNRFLRLFPTYWILLFGFGVAALAYSTLVNPIGPFFVAHQTAFEIPELIWAAFSNVTTAGSDTIILYKEVTGRSPDRLIFLPVVWSLSCEILFYAICPALVHRPGVMVGLLVVCLSLRLAISGLSNWNWTPWNYYFFPSVLPYFLLGSIAYRVGKTGGHELQRLASNGLVQLLVYCAIPLAVLFWGTVTFRFNREILIVLVVLLLPLLFHVSQSWRLDQWVGELSYPVYLVHSGILLLWAPIRHFVPNDMKFIVLVLLSVAASSLLVHFDGHLRSWFTSAFPVLRAGVLSRSELLRATPKTTGRKV